MQNFPVKIGHNVCVLAFAFLCFGLVASRAETLSNVFSGTITLDGRIDHFFVSDGASTNPLPGVSLGAFGTVGSPGGGGG